MKKILIILAIIFCCCQSKKSESNSIITPYLIAEVNGCSVYKFNHDGHDIYVSNCHIARLR
jgi:hypothetical protein